MAKKIDITTKKGADAAPDSPAPYYNRANKGLAIGLYKPGTGTRSWRARVRHEGKYRVEVLEGVTTYTEAVASALSFVDRGDKGQAPTRQQRAVAAKGSLTVQQLIEEYIDQEAMRVTKGERHSEWRYTSMRLSRRYVYPYLGSRKIASLAAEDIQGLQVTLRGEVSAETVNRGTVTLRAALNYGLAKGYIHGAFWKSVPVMEEAEHDDKANAKDYFDLPARQAFLEAAGAQGARSAAACT